MKMKRSLLFVLLGLTALVVSLGMFLIAKVIPENGKKTEESTGNISQTITGTEDTGEGKTSDNPSGEDKETSVDQDASVDKASSSDATSPSDPKELTTITFAVPNVNEIDEDYLRLFNQELQKDGHPYQLQIEYVKFDTYFEDLEILLNEGKVDISFMGLGDGSNNISRLLKSGKLVKLDEILTTDKGKALYEAFPKSMWEAVKVDGHIYSIPNATWSDAGLYAAFNKDHISEEAIEKWDGSLEGIYEMIKDVKWDDAAAPRFQYLLSDYDFDSMIGCEIRNGLLYDYETMQIENPLKSEKFIGYLRLLEKMKHEGFIKETVSYHQNASWADAEEAMKAGNFLAVLSVISPEGNKLGGNYVIKELAPVLKTRINGSIGITNDPDKTGACLDFLSLLYGQEKYGNLLIYGRLGETYKLENGFAVNMDGTDKQSAPWRETWLNLFINLHPARGEQFAVNRKEAMFDFYDHAQVSPFIGFVSDSDQDLIFSDDLDAFLEELNSKTLDEAIGIHSEKLKADGIDDYLDTVRSRWEAYQKESQS
ncbi:MAG: extracellular solute-binding protein [Clostridiales bacterium]|nr:extracellular solute-binding protein [Clostridiales bacterium]